MQQILEKLWQQAYLAQREYHQLTRNQPNFLNNSEMGTGKSLGGLIDYIANVVEEIVEQLIIVTPLAVKKTWQLDVFERFMPEDAKYTLRIYKASPGKALKELWDDLYKDLCPLPVIIIHPEALAGKEGFSEIQKLIRLRKTQFIIDESHKFKNPSSLRHKNLFKLIHEPNVKIRRLMTGSLVLNSPCDLHGQFMLLDWRILGHHSATTFKAAYAQILPSTHPLVLTIMARGARGTPQIIAKDPNGRQIWKNLDQLTAKIAPYTFRATKEAYLDLPPKVYSKRYCEIPPKHNKVYQDLKTLAIYQDEHGEMTAISKMEAVLRMQQVLGGFMPDGRSLYDDPLKNPKIEALLDCIEETDDPIIIWVAFVNELKQIVNILTQLYPDEKVEAYYGEISASNREESLVSFTSGKSRFFVATAATGGTGLNLTAAKTVIYYSNRFNLEHRIQSEDRAHRIGQTSSVNYIDLIYPNTLDASVLRVLKAKTDLSNQISQVNLKDLL